MITAILQKKDGRFTGYRARGHSGYAEAGSDIVCAGVSALSIAIVNTMESSLGILVNPRVDEESGMMEFDLPETEGERENGAQLLMSALAQGLRDLQDAYPEYLKFEIKERRK